jgi:hypothetical protein
MVFRYFFIYCKNVGMFCLQFCSVRQAMGWIVNNRLDVVRKVAYVAFFRVVAEFIQRS